MTGSVQGMSERSSIHVLRFFVLSLVSQHRRKFTLSRHLVLVPIASLNAASVRQNTLSHNVKRYIRLENYLHRIVCPFCVFFGGVFFIKKKEITPRLAFSLLFTADY
jgi:hypothetical protein